MNKKIVLFISFSSMLINSFAAFGAPPTPSVEVSNFPAEQDVSVTNFPAEQDVSVTNFPAVMDVNIENDARLQVRGGQVTGTEGGLVTMFLFAFSSNDLGTNYGKVPTGKKLVITDFNFRHAVNTSSGVSNVLIRSIPDGQTCEGASSDIRTEWSAIVPQGESIIASLTTGIEIPQGRLLCIGSSQGISLSGTIIGYITTE